MDRQEAIKIVRDNWPEGRVLLKSALETLIPELQESEDEKIRKSLIEYFESHHNDTEFCGSKVIDILDWLEKQGKIVEYYEDKLDRCTCENFNNGYLKALEVNGELIDKLVKYREWLISKPDWYTERENDKTNSNVGKHYCTGAANALICARAKFEKIVDYDSLLEKQVEPMTQEQGTIAQEEKELMFKDLSAKLPYGTL